MLEFATLAYIYDMMYMCLFKVVGKSNLSTKGHSGAELFYGRLLSRSPFVMQVPPLLH